MTHARKFSALLIVALSFAISARAQTAVSQTSEVGSRNPGNSRETSDIKGQKSGNGLLREPPTPDSCAKLSGQPINMLVLGDSILWGQGIDEKQKISFQVQDWLCTQTKRPVKIWREAHSGAVLEDGEPALTSECPAPPKQDDEDDKKKKPETNCGINGKECGGEVNVDDPTINTQLENAIKHYGGNGAAVDLVLMDGCINDFRVVNYLLNANYSPPCLRERAKAVCHDRMRRFLEKAVPLLPNARFIVTGYYPVITEQSARNVLLRLILGGFIARGKQKWLFPNAKEHLYQRLKENSEAFGKQTNVSLQLSVDEVNAGSGGRRISFVPVYADDGLFGKDGSGFAAPKKTSLLWTTRFNSTGFAGLEKFFYVIFRLGFHALQPNDQVYAARKLMCKDAEATGFAKLSCRVAAFGHPNTKGRDEYVARVQAELQRLMSAGWLAVEQ